MKPKKHTTVRLSNEDIARIDALIAKHSTPAHRLTRSEVLHALLETGLEAILCEQQGETPPTIH